MPKLEPKLELGLMFAPPPPSHLSEYHDTRSGATSLGLRGQLQSDGSEVLSVALGLAVFGRLTLIG